jgi:Tol biopolymer transport system component
MLAFVRASSPFMTQIYLQRLTEDYRAAGEPWALTREAGVFADPVWTPEGGEVIFAFGTGLSEQHLRRMPATGGRWRPLFFAQNASAPAISSDGRRLAFEERILSADIYRVLLPEEIDAALVGELQGQRFISSTRWEAGPRYSPDGTRVAFASERSGSREIWVCDSSGGNPRQLTFTGSFASFPAWSPDSKRLCFVDRPDGEQELFIVSAEGGTPVRLTSDADDNSFPSWSADGNWIYYQSNRSAIRELWKIPADGGEAVQVTEDGGLYGVESSDGKTLYFSRGNELWSRPTEGGEERRVLGPMRGNSTFEVRAQGIYFVGPDNDAESSRLRWFDFAGGAAKDVAVIPSPRGYSSISPDGQWLLYSRVEEQNSDLILVDGFR